MGRIEILANIVVWNRSKANLLFLRSGYGDVRGRSFSGDYWTQLIKQLKAPNQRDVHGLSQRN